MAKTLSTMAQVYAAACSADFFLFDQSRKLVYRGQLESFNELRSSGQS
jgi:hypothetical protein